MSKNKKSTIIMLLVEIIFPFILVPILPLLFKDCSEVHAFIIGSLISIFMAIVTLDHKADSISEGAEVYSRDNKRGFEKIQYRLDQIEVFLNFQKEIDNVESEYFKKRIIKELKKNIYDFKEEHHDLFSGYVETNPYSNDTYGVEGLKYTKNELLAVSSVQDYWDRKGFVAEYLNTQLLMISEQSIVVKRIFIGEYEKLKSTLPLMKKQLDGGIEVFYIVSDNKFCKEEWKEEDFLIQDKQLIVDLKLSSHASDAQGKEIITTRDILVNDKIELFTILLNNATRFDGNKIEFAQDNIKEK